MRLLNIYRKDARNAGDLKSSPFLYFKFDADQESVDVLAVKGVSNLSDYDAVIVGGGGLLEDKWFMPSLAHIRDKCRGKLILWGAGLNNHFHEQIIYFAPSFATRRRLLWKWLSGRRTFVVKPPAHNVRDSSHRDVWLKSCDMAGVRDHGTAFDWVPCVSCMDSRLDHYRNIAPEHPLVAIDHPDFCKIELNRIPRFSNIGNNFDSILSFIASGETVLCASYHAAYWAILMGRKVVVVPWSEKFLRFKQTVPACSDSGELQDCIKRSIRHPEALKECRESNLAFASKVANLLNLRWSRV
jgi:hypothetical protein